MLSNKMLGEITTTAEAEAKPDFGRKTVTTAILFLMLHIASQSTHRCSKCFCLQSFTVLDEIYNLNNADETYFEV